MELSATNNMFERFTPEARRFSGKPNSHDVVNLLDEANEEMSVSITWRF
jgi:hypothetical protein